MTLVVTFFHFRQLRPSNRIAHRDAMTNKCNMKKLQINAQVTAMTTLIEHIGNVTSLVVTIHFTTNLSWFLSRLILEILFYCIIVPHSFLMNTSDNKNRIMEYGWKGVIQNLIGRRSNRTAAGPNCNEENVPTAPKTISENSNNADNNQYDLSQKENEGAEATQTFTTSKISFERDETASTLEGLVAKRLDTTVKSKSGIIKHGRKCSSELIEMQENQPNAPEILSVGELEKQGRKHEMMQKMIRRMLNTIHDEESYLERFTNLLIFNNLCAKGMVVSEYEMENIPFCKTKGKTDIDGNDEEHDGDGSDNTFVSSSNTRTFRKFDDRFGITEAWIKDIVKPPLKGCVEDRINARKQMVLHLSSLFGDHETCEQAIRKWIDLEEGFVDNQG